MRRNHESSVATLKMGVGGMAQKVVGGVKCLLAGKSSVQDTGGSFRSVLSGNGPRLCHKEYPALPSGWLATQEGQPVSHLIRGGNLQVRSGISSV